MGSWKNSVNVSILGSELVNDRGGKFENGIDTFEIYHFSLFLRFVLMKFLLFFVTDKLIFHRTFAINNTLYWDFN